MVPAVINYTADRVRTMIGHDATTERRPARQIVPGLNQSGPGPGGTKVHLSPFLLKFPSQPRPLPHRVPGGSSGRDLRVDSSPPRVEFELVCMSFRRMVCSENSQTQRRATTIRGLLWTNFVVVGEAVLWSASYGGSGTRAGRFTSIARQRRGEFREESSIPACASRFLRS